MPKEIIEGHKYIQHSLPLIALGWTVISFLLGHFMGHRSAIKRDKRKEFNEIAEPLLEFYEELLIQLQHEGYFSTTKFPIELLGKIERRLSPRNQKEFNHLVKDIIAMQHTKNGTDREVLINKIKRMCKIIHLR
ncbi:hypothetical protein [Enterobacter cloacae complex sp. IR5422]|uniref:hypothetical protein n=1 Tax=Enterobacter cloacae complex sp. IR5422 TaxID=3412363 RepID=UPI003BA05285